MNLDRYFYVAKCLLGFSALESWTMTPRQISTLYEEYVHFNMKEVGEDG